MKQNDSAFPFEPTANNPNGGSGLTKRELFAAMAMQGFCANSAINNNLVLSVECARDALEYADALIAELGWEK